MMLPLRLPITGLLLATALATAWGQTVQPPAGRGIYTCIDAKGRRLTSDRPIVECIDREQKELNPSGTVRRTVPPSPTAPERAALEERERKAAEERQRQAEERRVARALLTRYPGPAEHNAERVKALQAQEDVILAGQRRIEELKVQRKALDTEAEFYKDPSRWPPRLKRQVDEVEQQKAAQQRFIAAQEEEKSRINARFDEELARLKILWAQRGTAAVGGSPGRPVAP